jgi:hypothetical protein
LEPKAQHIEGNQQGDFPRPHQQEAADGSVGKKAKPGTWAFPGNIGAELVLTGSFIVLRSRTRFKKNGGTFGEWERRGTQLAALVALLITFQ